MNKDKCEKGQSCGLSCINKNYECKDKIGGDLLNKGPYNIKNKSNYPGGAINKYREKSKNDLEKAISAKEDYIDGWEFGDYDLNNKRLNKLDERIDNSLSKTPYGQKIKAFRESLISEEDVDLRKLKVSGEGWDLVKLNQDTKEFYKLTGFKIPEDLIIFDTERERPFMMSKDGKYQIYLNPKTYTKSELWHELAHVQEEEYPEIYERNQKWVKGRATSEEIGFLDDENEELGMGYQGNYPDPYYGRVYESKNTEVLSLGIEAFAYSYTMAELASKDKELFEIILEEIRKNAIK